MFGMFGARQNSNPAPAPAPAPTPPTPAPAPAPNPAPAPGQQQQPAPAPAPAPAPTPAPVDLMASLLGSAPQANDPAALTRSFFDALSNLPGDEVGMSVPIIRPDAIAGAFANVDMTAGIDAAALLQTLSGDPQQASQALTKAFQQTSVNTITAIIPLINQLVERAALAATQQATQQSHQGVLANQIVQSFRAGYPTATDPIIMNMVAGFANTIAKQAPAGANAAEIAAKIGQVLTGMSALLPGSNNHQSQPGMGYTPGAQTAFSDLFSGA